MSKKKKVNPQRQIVTVAELKRVKKRVYKEAVCAAMAIFFTVLRDKEGFEVRDLQRVWSEVNNLSDAVSEGYVTLADLRNTLKEEAGIYIER